MFLVVAISFLAYYNKGLTTIALAPLLAERSVDIIFFAGLSAFDIFAIFLALAAFVKSAQIFFHT